MLLSESPRLQPAHYRILALAFLGWMFDFYDLILYTFLTRFISADLGLTKLDHARALGISFTATAVGGIACGFLADRYGRRTVVSWTILLYSAGSLLSGLSTGRQMLFLARGLTGTILQTGAPVGVGLAALVGTLLAPRIGWRACLIYSSATALLAFVARRGLPESDLWLRQGTRSFAAGLDRLIYGDLAKRFYLALLLCTVNGASYWLTYSWLPEYLRSRGLGLAQSGAWLGVVVGGEIVGYVVYGWFSDHLGRRPAFVLFALTMATGLLPLTIFWDRFAATPSLLLGAMLLVGIGTGTWSNFGPMLAELFPTQVRNSAMSSVLNVSRGAQFGAPVLITLLEPRYGLSAGIGLAAGFAVAAAALIWTLPETRARTISA